MDKKYILTEWPESQDFLGYPDCYLAHVANNNEKIETPAYFVPENLFIELKCNNKQVTEISTLHEQYQSLENMIRENIRHFLLGLLVNTSEENPYECKIDIIQADDHNISPDHSIIIYQMYQIDNEIYFFFDTAVDDPVSFDEMLLEDLVTVCKELDK